VRVTFLGTGTSQGVPMIACNCGVCRSTDPRNRRARTSVHVEMDGVHVQVDAAPEFRLQCVALGIEKLDVFLLTHGHADHVLGMDDLRRFCDGPQPRTLPVYSTPEGLARVRAVFPYADRPAVRYSGYPSFDLQEMPPVLELPGGGRVETVLLPHGSVQTLGLVFTEASTGKRFGYYTDCKEVGPQARALARGCDALVLDGLRHEPHPTHMNIAEAVACAADIAAGVTYLTHLTHAVDHVRDGAALPAGVHFAHDGLVLEL
jgi:phosphoribosyl 1,2-cyclic phosphate phosphodiesterase